MNAQEMITSGLLESFVLGLATPEEVLQVQAALDQYPELVREIEKIEKALLAISDGGQAPRPHLRDNILAQINVPAIPSQSSSWVKTQKQGYAVAVAACLALFVVSAVFNLLFFNRVSSLKTEVADTRQKESILSVTVDQQRSDIETLKQQLKIVSDPTNKAIVLKGVNGCKDQTTSVYWNSTSGEVYFNTSLLVSGPQQDYQLWAIVDGKPVDAGVIRFDQKTSLTRMKPITNASAFAVTLENKGGSGVPTLSAMCFLGEV